MCERLSDHSVDSGHGQAAVFFITVGWEILFFAIR